MHMVENALQIVISSACFEAIFKGHAKREEDKCHEVFTWLVKDASFKETFCLVAFPRALASTQLVV